MRIGLISDTHLPSLVRSLDELGPEIADALRGLDLILHGGDVTAPSALEWCAQFAPVLVAEGNNDIFKDPRMIERHILDIEGWRIGMAHELRPESRPIQHILHSSLGGEQVDVLIGGDTHVERLEYRDGVLLINSGSPILPHHLSTRLGSIAILEVTRDRVSAEIIALGPSEGLRNPVLAQHVVIGRQGVLEASLVGHALTAEHFHLTPAERHKRLIAASNESTGLITAAST